MPRKGPQVRSPAHAVYLHPVLSVATLALIGGGAYASIAFFGDPNAAGPRAIVKLAPVAEGPLRAVGRLGSRRVCARGLRRRCDPLLPRARAGL